jgi:hypothetical protein
MFANVSMNLFPQIGTMLSLVPKHEETIENPLWRNNHFPRPSSGSSATTHYRANASCQLPRTHPHVATEKRRACRHTVPLRREDAALPSSPRPVAVQLEQTLVRHLHVLGSSWLCVGAKLGACAPPLCSPSPPLISGRRHYKKPCDLWRSIFVTDHPIFIIKQHLWWNFIRHGWSITNHLSWRINVFIMDWRNPWSFQTIIDWCKAQWTQLKAQNLWRKWPSWINLTHHL